MNDLDREPEWSMESDNLALPRGRDQLHLAQITLALGVGDSKRAGRRPGIDLVGVPSAVRAEVVDTFCRRFDGATELGLTAPDAVLVGLEGVLDLLGEREP